MKSADGNIKWYDVAFFVGAKILYAFVGICSPYVWNICSMLATDFEASGVDTAYMFKVQASSSLSYSHLLY